MPAGAVLLQLRTVAPGGAMVYLESIGNEHNLSEGMSIRAWPRSANAQPIAIEHVSDGIVLHLDDWDFELYRDDELLEKGW